jgi:hypothetical protein
MAYKQRMALPEFVKSVPGLNNWKHTEKITFFAWCLHTFLCREHFAPAEIGACYDELHLQKPSSFGSYVAQLAGGKQKQLLKSKRGYYLSKNIRDELAAKYGQRQATVEIDKLLADLPNQISNSNERIFLDEALACFRCGAFRASIVMCWNLAFDHLCEWIIKNHIVDFNIQLPKTCPTAKVKSIKTKDDFSHIKESEVLQVCKSANIITGNLHKILVEKLGRRNTAAHPSSVVITQLQAEDFISDLVNNVVLKLT